MADLGADCRCCWHCCRSSLPLLLPIRGIITPLAATVTATTEGDTVKIDRHNPYNRTDGYLSESVAAEIAAEIHGAEMAELAALLAACREMPSELVPVAVDRPGWQPSDTLGSRVTRYCTAAQLADTVRHEISRQLAVKRSERQLQGMAERIARINPVWDRRMRRNGSARRSSVVVLS